jgi:hypothetical protein
MATLTLEDLANANPEAIGKTTFIINKKMWDNIDINILSKLPQPEKLLFNDTIRDSLGTLKNKKGIYIFCFEPLFPNPIPEIRYLVYVGRVTKNDTFFKRFYEYVKCIGDKNAKRNRQLLTNLCPDKTWVYFYELSLTDSEITEIEDELIDNIVPPLNNAFKARKAMNSHSILN